MVRKYLSNIKKNLAGLLATITLFTANPASADRFEFFGGYSELYESGTPKVTLDMRADAEFNKTVHLDMRNKIGYAGEYLIDLENSLNFRLSRKNTKCYTQYFGPLLEFDIDDLKIPKPGLFFQGMSKDFMFYLGFKLLPQENFGGETIIELSYIPEKGGFMVYGENRTIFDFGGDIRNNQTIRMGYRSDNSFGIGVGADVIGIGDGGIQSWSAGAYLGLYSSNRKKK